MTPRNPDFQDRLGEIGRTAARACDRAVRAGASVYMRERDLPALIRTDPFASLPDSHGETLAILARLERALRAERNKARAGHWTYDLNRHIALRQAYLAEADRLKRLFPGAARSRRSRDG